MRLTTTTTGISSPSKGFTNALLLTVLSLAGASKATGQPRSAADLESLAASARAGLRPEWRPSPAAMSSISATKQRTKRRSEMLKLAGRRAAVPAAGFAFLDPRADSGMPLPMQIRAASASEDPDVEDNFDCSEYQSSAAPSTWSAPSAAPSSSSSEMSITPSAAPSTPPVSFSASVPIHAGYGVGNPGPSSSATIPSSSPYAQQPASTASSPAAANTASPSASPSPSQSSSSGACTKYHTVVSGEICLGIVNYPENAGLTLSNLLLWNPAINSDCTNLNIGQVLCTAKSLPLAKRRIAVWNAHWSAPAVGQEAASSASSSIDAASVPSVATSQSSSSGDEAQMSGQATFFAVGLGACGIVNTESDAIVAVSDALFDTYLGGSKDLSKAPICGKQIEACHGSRCTTVTVTDRCAGCAYADLDFSPSAFSRLADETQGRIDITWSWNR